MFFFTDTDEPLAGEILRATLTATAEENSKLKLLTMPGNEKRHAEAIAEARGRGVTVKLVQYDRSDDDQEEDVVDVTIREAASAEDLREIESRIR